MIPDRSRAPHIRRSPAFKPWLGGRGALSFYPPGLAQAPHEHERPHLSLVLSGGFAEQVGGRTIERHSGEGIRRDAGVRHAVQFGRTGALILNLEDDDGAEFDEGVVSGRLALRGAYFVAPAAPAPGWLLAARDRLLHDPGPVTVEALARQCGVHRVHFSRMFRRHFGVRPSVFRTRGMVSQALMLTLTHELSLADAALEAGFSDQAHLTRAVKSSCGLPVGALRTFLT